MDEARRTAQRLWGQFSAWYRGAGRGVQIGVAVGTLVVICVCCSGGISALGKGGASSTPTTGIAAHQTTANTGGKATATKTATKAPRPTATKASKPTATATPRPSGVTTATLGGVERTFIAAYGPYDPPPNATTEFRDHHAIIQGQDTAITVALTSNDDNMRVRFITVQPTSAATTWSNSQAEKIAKTFLPPDAVYMKDMNAADFGLEHIYTSKLLAASFPADAFTDAQSGNTVAAGTFYLACGDQTDGPGKCSMQLGE